MSGIVADAAKRADLGRVHAHRLRHTAARELLRAGASLPEIGQLLRHRRVETTAIYAKVDEGNRTVRHERLDQYIIETIEEAQDFATQGLWTYNNDRPNMGIGGITPAQKLKMAA